MFASRAGLMVIPTVQQSVTEDDTIGGVDSNKKTTRRRFNLFHHKQKKTHVPASNSSLPHDPDAKVKFESEASELQDELPVEPSKVLQTNGDAAVNVTPIQPPERDGSDQSEGGKGVIDIGGAKASFGVGLRV